MKVDLDNDFRLSRIEAEGWNAAHRYMIEETTAPDEFQTSDLNPYRADPARGRWLVGFRHAVTAIGAK
jgi:hypothetical protein